MKARIHLSQSLQQDSPLVGLYLVHLLESIISKGDVHESDNTNQTDVELAAREIVSLLRPLASLVSIQHGQSHLVNDENIAHLYREAWFNVVVHGITPTSQIGQRCLDELRILATESLPLIAEDRANQFESEIELNAVLRRGMNAAHTVAQKRSLISLLPLCESDIKALSYPKVLFLIATYFLETIRAGTGTCHHILTYFLDPSLNGSAMENCMVAITDEVLTTYLKRISRGHHQDVPAPLIAKQLTLFLAGCCHRILRVQQAASTCADKIINQMPSLFCHKSSLFALLDLLTMMWTSCLEAEIDEYNWKPSFISVRWGISVEMSDDFELRRRTLNYFYKRARAWLTKTINIAPIDVKGLLQV